MKFCQPHWDELRAAIHDRGLDALIAKDGKAVAAGMAAGTFEPLMGAHNAILSQALSHFGIAAMLPQDDGSECPLAFVEKHAATCAECAANPNARAAGWIRNASDEVLRYAREHKLIGEPS